ncbi:MAG: hypothetical protein K0S01_70 [Herbinix sp.]|nr:hypothetical protein [Herbinix sp.]
MKDRIKIPIYFLAYGFVFLCLNKIIISVYKFDITIVERTTIILVMLLGIGVITYSIFGIVIQIIYHVKFSKNIKISIAKNSWRQVVMIVIYAVCIFSLYITNAAVGYSILVVAILPLVFNRICIKCNQYFILFENKLLYLGDDFIIYQVERVHIDKENSAYILFMTSEAGTKEKLVLPESKLNKYGKRNDLMKWFREC